jgi:hypothetical protein
MKPIELSQFFQPFPVQTTTIIVANSNSGKSFYVRHMLKNQEYYFEPVIKRVIIVNYNREVHFEPFQLPNEIETYSDRNAVNIESIEKKEEGSIEDELEHSGGENDHQEKEYVEKDENQGETTTTTTTTMQHAKTKLINNYNNNNFKKRPLPIILEYEPGEFNLDTLQPNDVLVFEDLQTISQSVLDSINLLCHHKKLAHIFIITQGLLKRPNFPLVHLVYQVILFTASQSCTQLFHYLIARFFFNIDTQNYLREIASCCETNDWIVHLSLNKPQHSPFHLCLAQVHELKTNGYCIVFPFLHKLSAYEELSKQNNIKAMKLSDISDEENVDNASSNNNDNDNDNDNSTIVTNDESQPSEDDFSSDDGESDSELSHVGNNRRRRQQQQQQQHKKSRPLPPVNLPPNSFVIVAGDRIKSILHDDNNDENEDIKEEKKKDSKKNTSDCITTNNEEDWERFVSDLNAMVTRSVKSAKLFEAQRLLDAVLATKSLCIDKTTKRVKLHEQFPSEAIAILDFILLSVRKRGPAEKYNDNYRKCYAIAKELLCVGNATEQYFKNEYVLMKPLRKKKYYDDITKAKSPKRSKRKLHEQLHQQHPSPHPPMPHSYYPYMHHMPPPPSYLHWGDR